MLRNRRLAALVACVALAGAACGGSDRDSAKGTAATAATPVGSASAADVAFVQGMIPHHEQAIEMADLALATKAGASAPIKDLAARVKAAQGPEITMMKGWLAEWKAPLHAAGTAGHGSTDAHGMMSDADMKALAAAQPGEFDKLWRQMMIEHHQGAIVAAEAVKKDGTNPAVRALADAIITAQTKEIEEMKGNT